MNCQWSDWSLHGHCTKTCGGGTQTWVRTELMKASNGGNPCQGSNIRSDPCNVQPCVVNCQWSDWSLHGHCTKTCGGGTQAWTRTELVKASYGGKLCQGSNIRSNACNVQQCPVHCQWSDWSKHGHCSKTCGGGIQAWARTELVKPSNGGRPCQGSNIRSGPCNVQPCAVNCQWSDWSLHGHCTKTCGGGMQTFVRTKIVKASNGGSPCQGSNIRSDACNVQPCAVNCQWSDWFEEGICSKTCGGGTQAWIRTELVKSQHGGSNCVGCVKKIEHCNRQNCLVQGHRTWGV